jgi:hypothetical protein
MATRTIEVLICDRCKAETSPEADHLRSSWATIAIKRESFSWGTVTAAHLCISCGGELVEWWLDKTPLPASEREERPVSGRVRAALSLEDIGRLRSDIYHLAMGNMDALVTTMKEKPEPFEQGIPSLVSAAVADEISALVANFVERHNLGKDA